MEGGAWENLQEVFAGTVHPNKLGFRQALVSNLPQSPWLSGFLFRPFWSLSYRAGYHISWPLWLTSHVSFTSQKKVPQVLQAPIPWCLFLPFKEFGMQNEHSLLQDTYNHKRFSNYLSLLPQWSHTRLGPHQLPHFFLLLPVPQQHLSLSSLNTFNQVFCTHFTSWDPLQKHLWTLLAASMKSCRQHAVLADFRFLQLFRIWNTRTAALRDMLAKLLWVWVKNYCRRAGSCHLNKNLYYRHLGPLVTLCERLVLLETRTAVCRSSNYHPLLFFVLWCINFVSVCHGFLLPTVGLTAPFNILLVTTPFASTGGICYRDLGVCIALVLVRFLPLSGFRHQRL